MKKTEFVAPKSQVVWGFFNYTILQGVAYTRKDAVRQVEELTGAPWSDAKRYMQILKVNVAPILKQQGD